MGEPNALSNSKACPNPPVGVAILPRRDRSRPHGTLPSPLRLSWKISSLWIQPLQHDQLAPFASYTLIKFPCIRRYISSVDLTMSGLSGRLVHFRDQRPAQPSKPGVDRHPPTALALFPNQKLSSFRFMRSPGCCFCRRIQVGLFSLVSSSQSPGRGSPCGASIPKMFFGAQACHWANA